MPNDFAYPRPEYPRPDRQRGTIEGIDWLNLNGPWQFRFDPQRKGEERGWPSAESQDWREQIIVPFCWESLAAWGEGDAAGNENYYSTRVFLNPLDVTPANHRSATRHEVGWYRRSVEIPDHPRWQGKRVILTIGAADFFTDCWCNGQHLGHHEGGYTPFEYDLTDTLVTDHHGRRTALIVLRVEDPMDNHEQPVGKQWRWYTTVSGIWQTVYLEPRSTSYIEKFRIITDIDSGTAHFAVQCANTDNSFVISAQIIPPKGDPQNATFAVKNGDAHESVIISPVFLWNPNEPHLYKTVLELQQGKEVIDRIQTYFGMRKIDFAPSEEAGGAVALRLNNMARYLRGALHQSYYPEGVYTAGEVSTLKHDIEYAKRVGFNFLRIHIKIDDPLLLYWADRLGMMIMVDFPNFGEGGDTPIGRRRFEQMMREAIDRDFNHPAIFAWCMFNETWGFGGQSEFVNLIHPVNPKNRLKPVKLPGAVSASGPEETGAPFAAGVSASGGGVAVATKSTKVKLANLSSHAWVQSMWELAKKLDPTRLIEDMSVCQWEHLDYYAHGDTDINSWHFYIDDYERAKQHLQKVVESTYVGSDFNYVPGYKHKGQPLINSEYGGVGALDGDVDISWTFKFLTNEMRRHEQISAYIFTELHDVEWEHNGFLNYDRTPKAFGYDPSIINESDTLPMDAPPIARHPPGTVLKVPVASS
ncbi:MAG TPA: glycoside hydrolase family 2, partial [Terriglobia bacterium]|nr:glycoside hydrolase family 2 [Terriglobia bacterium]